MTEDDAIRTLATLKAVQRATLERTGELPDGVKGRYCSRGAKCTRC